MNTLERLSSQQVERVSIFLPEEVRLIREIELFGLRQNAEKYLDKRGFPQIFQKKADELGGRIIRPDMANSFSRPEALIAEDSAFLAIVWDEIEFTEEERIAKTILVEALQNGYIVIHGNIVGSTVLSSGDLINQRNLVKALEKATERCCENIILGFSGEEDKR
jgi:hypothetical protein